MLICLGSVKGGAGVTTFAVALAARWPAVGLAPVVLELDPAGGDLGTRWHTHDEPGLAGMVLAARRGPLGDARDWVQRLPIGKGRTEGSSSVVDAVVAPAADAAAAALAEFARLGPAAVRDLAGVRPVLADVGRLDPGSPMLPYLDKADELLLIARPQLDQLRHVQARLPVLRARCQVVRLVLIGAGPYPAAEIVAHLQVPVAVSVPDDPVGAAILAGQKQASMGWTRRPLLAAARTVALACAPATPAAQSPGAAAAPDVVQVSP